MSTPYVMPDGFRLLPGKLSRSEQLALIDAVIASQDATPFWRPSMPRTGQPLSVMMTNFGSLGWVTDKIGGYRYEPRHPETGRAWSAMPDALTSLWREVADYPADAEACLVNWYAPESKMGMHVDWDEEATDAAVVSISLGDKARFRLGAAQRGGKTASMVLSSGDVVVLGGAARRCYHGVDRIYPGTSTLLPPEYFPGGGRINLTMRRVKRP
ncbi:alpha-ketoglutarate-dependent dioxygenase AlkB [Maricaulis sp.]|uniref:alpha-ketoglutarate-dependent dioxygenase AlkB n=1 Tax=Maricaulis sp. TaxID=1486257 RepID=UPI002B26E0E9|nr:alpha-ketoglutarate-dependent dioxygenase AlkB [Maricaulis sp.]